MDDQEHGIFVASMFGGVIGILIGVLIVMLFRVPVDPDLRRIQQQRNAWSQYQEAAKP